MKYIRRGENKLRDKQLRTLFAENPIASSNLIELKGDKGDLGLRGLPGLLGLPGQEGYTPVKGVDYFDGTDGNNGEQGIQGIQGEAGSGVTLSAVKADTDIASALSLKHSNSTDHTSGSDNQDISGKVDKITNYSLVLNTEISKIHSSDSDNQDLSGLQPKETGKGLSANDFTSVLKTSYDGAVTHTGSVHAPSGAEVNVNADWNSGSGDSQIINKPSIPAAQVQTDWNASSGMGQLLNKPTVPNVRLLANLAAPVVTSGTTEKVLLQLQIPAAGAVVGSTFRTWIVGNSSSTGTLIFKVRCGATGTITDTIDWTAVTSVAQVANATAGFEVIITIRSSTTIAVRGVGYAGTIQLPTVIGAPTTPAIVVSNPWYINLTVICSLGTFTAQVGNIEEIK